MDTPKKSNRRYPKSILTVDRSYTHDSGHVNTVHLINLRLIKRANESSARN